MTVFLRALSVVALTTSSLVGVACGEAETASTTDPDEDCPRVVLDGGDTIPEPPDGASLCPEGNSCNYQSQEGCAANMSCYPVIMQGMTDIVSACRPAGTGVSGDACDSPTDCARGHVCPDGQCRKLCCGADWSDDACDPGEGCYRELFYTVDEGDPNTDEDDVNESTGAFLCYPTGCDVFRTDECATGRDCKIIFPNGTTACVPPTPGDEGERCTPPIVCGPRLSCVGPPGEERCRRLCRAEECGEPACEPGDTCVHFNRDPPGVGECTPDWPDP
jgi:hypothetical protein